jgi:NAD(P)-dependent dehydrogenase (short-subunit alcohol dehydrogenase family)
MAERKYARYPSLDGCPVLVTGGASGIGEGMVKAFAEQGAKVGFLDIAEEAGRRLADEIAGKGQTAVFEPCNLMDIDALKAAIASLADRNGPALVLVNNAAHDQRHAWEDVTSAYWDDRIAVNLKHFFFATQAVAPGMMARGWGSIINFGSISWRVMTGEMLCYTTAKAAVHGMTRSFAAALGQHGVRVNTLEPGWVMTERQLKLWVTPDAEPLIDASQALKGRVLPEDLARAALFLASDDAAMITAQTLTVDAGWT